MYFRRVIIKNMLCIRYKDLELTRGLIGVFGKNGRGKSTLLNLMYALLTNDFSRFPGTRAQCINNLSDKKEEAYVYGEVVVDEHVLKIRRGLRQPAKSELVVDEEPAITDANKIKERIEEIIKMNSTLLDLFVFKQQDKIYDVFVATEATRKEAFQALNRTEKCELIHDRLGKALEVDQRAMDGFVDNSDEILQTQSAVRDSIKELEDEIASKSSLLLNDVSFESANRIVSDWKLRRDLTIELDDARDVLPDLKTKRDNRDAKVTERKADIADAVSRLEKLKPRATAAAAALQTVETYEAQRKRKRALTAEAQELNRQYTERKSPTPVKTPKDFELKKAEATLTTLRAELKKAQDLFIGFDATGVHKCSECGTVLDRLDDKVLAKNRKIIETHPQQIQELSDLIDDVESYNSASEAYARWFAGHSAKVKANEEAQKAIGDLKVPDQDKEELQKTIDDCETLEEMLETSRSSLSELQETAARSQAAVETQQQKIREIKEKLEQLTVTEEKYERARTRLREHTEAREAIAEVRGELRTKQARLKELDVELETVEHKAKRFQKTRQLLKIYQRAREVTHRDGLPTRVSQTNLAKLEGYVNDELANFGDPFWVETGEDLQFIVHKPGEPAQTAPWLSTGWKCILAASFWMTIVTTWGCGMLCLDEPTANLDEDNRAFLAEALSRLTGRIRGNRQVIMVSHAEELRSSFDQVIDFTPEDEHVQAG